MTRARPGDGRDPVRIVHDAGPALGSPWVGVRALGRLAPPAEDPRVARVFAASAHNVVRNALGAWIGRPPFRRLAKPATGPAQFLGSLELGPNVWATFAVVGGQLRQFEWATETWGPNLVPAGRTIAQPGRVALAYFAERLVVSDGVNDPWALDLDTGTASAIGAATSAWYGRPVQHAGKLFWRRADDPLTIEWTDEGTLATGGTAAGALNVWALRQTSEGAIVALAALNEGIVAFRETSALYLLGSSSDDFRAATTTDDASSRHGTRSPWGVLVDEGRVLFIDQGGRLRAFTPGGGVEPLVAAPSSIAGLEDLVVRAELDEAWLAPHPDLRAFVAGLPLDLADPFRRVVVVGEDGAPHGTWAHGAGVGGDFRLGAALRDDAGTVRFAHMDADGDVYLQATDREAETQRADTYGATTVPVPAIRLEFGPFAADPQRLEAEAAWDLVTAKTGDGERPTALELRLARERAPFPVDSAPITAPAGGTVTVGRVAHGASVRAEVRGTADLRPGETFGRFRLWGLSIAGTPRGTPTRSR